VPWLMHTLDAHMPNEATVSTAVQQFFEGKKGIKKSPSEYFDQFYIAAVAWESYLADTINGWPNHNIIIGSELRPRRRGCHLAENRRRDQNLGETDIEKVLGGNAMKMFGLNGNGAGKH